MAAFSEIVIEQGATFSTTINVEDTAGAAINLYGYTANSMMRKSYYSSSATTITFASKLDGIASGATNVTNTNQLTNGAGFVTSSGVTSVATGNGLTGGTITSTGTLTMSGSYTGAFAVTGAVTATGDITAGFSDRRLKTNIKPIEFALAKVNSLNGIAYTPNDLAETFGHNKNENIVGLFADEVESILPEAVKLAPFDIGENGASKSGENYKTIQYEKLVPLLIEAIKELNSEIEELKRK